MKLFEKNELKLLWPFYLEVLISTLFFFAAAFMVVYFNNLGFSIFQIGVLTSSTWLASLVFEIPTGAVADVYGRKFSVLLGFFIEGLGALLIFFFTDFYYLVFVFAFIGFGATFSSGAKEAWVVDLVKSNQKLMKNYFVKISSVLGFSAIFSGIIGAWFVKNFGLRPIWLVGSVSFLVSIIFLLFARENFSGNKPTVKKSLLKLKNQTEKSFWYTKRHPVLSYLILASIVGIFASLLESAFTWIPYLQEVGLQDHQFGYLFSAMGVMGFVAPLIGGKLSRIGKEKKFIMFSIALTILCTVFIIFTNTLIPALTIFMLTFLFSQMYAPISSVYFQKFAPSKMRATITSVKSMLSALAGVIFLPIVGLIVDKIGPKYSIFLSAIFSLPVLFIYLKIREPRQKN